MHQKPPEQRVLLVDDHPVYRDGLKMIVNSHPQLRVAAEADNVTGALELLERTSPHLMITDLRLGQSSGHDLIEAALEKRPNLKVVVISINDQGADVVRAVEAGASAYLTKGANGEQILRALSEVLEGRSFLHTEVAHLLFQRVRRNREMDDSNLGNTPREREIIDMLLQGRSPTEIGQALFLSASTVKTHLRNLYRKHGVSSRSQLILKMLEDRGEA